MPSGHGSSGGGGSHGGGSHFGGGNGSNYRPSRPIHYMWHGRYYYVPATASGKIISCIMTVAFSIFFCAILIFGIFGNISSRDTIIADRNRYLSMIEYAEQHTEYQREGRVKAKVYNEDAEKWYYEYIILTDDGFQLEGYTYSVYDYDEIQRINLNDKVIFAVDETPVTLNTDSINMDYKNIPLEADGEYSKSFSTNKIMTGIVALFIVIAIISIVSGIKTFVKNVAQKKEDSDGITQRSHESQDSQSNNKEQDVFSEYYETPIRKKRCPYCGSEMGENDKKCKNCGAER